MPDNARPWVLDRAAMAHHLHVPAILTLLLAFVVAALFALKARNRYGRADRPKPPPGKLGWPMIGETLELLGHQRSGKPFEFFDTRIAKYGQVFKTSLVGHPTAVFCEPAGNRFLFANENKVVVSSWPTSVGKLLGNCLIATVGGDAKRLRSMLMTFLKPEALQKFVARVDSITKNHLAKHWSGKQQVTAFPLIKEYTFSLACSLFASVEDECEQARLSAHFNMLLKGVLQIPINLPGTRYYKAKRAADAIRTEIQKIIDRRIANGSAAAQQDLLSYLLCSVDERGISLTHDEVKDNILLLLFAGHDTSSSTLAALLKYLAEQPACYRQVLSGHTSLRGRAGHTTTLVGRQLFVLGGRNGNVFFNDVWVFDVELEQWKQLEQKAPFAPRAYHTTTLIGDQELWMIGGSDHNTMFDDVHVLNIVTLQWSSPTISGSDTIRRRGTHAAVLHPVQNRAILIHGGYGGTDPQWLGDLSLLCTDSLEWHVLNPGGAVPRARGYHSLTTVGAYAVLYGGKGDAGIVKEDCLSVYDVATNVWVNPNVQGNPPLPRSNHAATLMDANFIIIHGGRHGALRLSDMFVLQVFWPPVSSISTLNLKWHIVEKAKTSVNARQSLGKRSILTAEADSPHGRSAHSLIARDRALYIFGGYGGHGLTFNDIFVLCNFPGLQGLVQLDKLDPTSNYGQTPIMVADNSDEENTQGWCSTKRPKQQIYHDPKSMPRLQEVGQALRRAFDTSPFRNQDALNNTKIRSPELVDETRQSSQRLQVQGVSNMEDDTSAMMAREKDAFQNEVKSLQKIIDCLKQDVKEKTCIEAELRTDKLRLQQELDSLDEKRSELKNVIEVLEKKVQLMNQKIKNSEAQNENLKAQIQVLKASLEEKERQSYEVAQEAKDAHHKCEELAGSLDNVRSFCSEVVRERDECKSCVEKLQSELEMQMQTLQQLNLKFENEKTFLLNEVAERKATADRILTELGTSKEYARALQDTVDEKTKQLEAGKSKADVLQKEKEELSQSNAVLVAENRQLLAARDAANANFDFIKSELTSTRALYERSTVEVIRLKEKVEQSREHIASLHESLKMSEENMKIKHQEIERLRALINEVEQFGQVQMAALQQHLEKVKCARQSCPL